MLETVQPAEVRAEAQKPIEVQVEGGGKWSTAIVAENFKTDKEKASYTQTDAAIASKIKEYAPRGDGTLSKTEVVQEVKQVGQPEVVTKNIPENSQSDSAKRLEARFNYLSSDYEMSQESLGKRFFRSVWESIKDKFAKKDLSILPPEMQPAWRASQEAAKQKHEDKTAVLEKKHDEILAQYEAAKKAYVEARAVLLKSIEKPGEAQQPQEVKSEAPTSAVEVEKSQSPEASKAETGLSKLEIENTYDSEGKPTIETLTLLAENSSPDDPDRLEKAITSVKTAKKERKQVESEDIIVIVDAVKDYGAELDDALQLQSGEGQDSITDNAIRDILLGIEAVKAKYDESGAKEITAKKMNVEIQAILIAEKLSKMKIEGFDTKLIADQVPFLESNKGNHTQEMSVMVKTLKQLMVNPQAKDIAKDRRAFFKALRPLSQDYKLNFKK